MNQFEYEISKEDITKMINKFNNLFTDIFWSFDLSKNNEKLDARVIDIFGENQISSKLRFQDIATSEFGYNKEGIDAEGFRNFSKSFLKKICEIEKERVEISFLCKGAHQLRKIARNSPFVKIEKYAKVFEKYGKKLNLPSPMQIKFLDKDELLNLEERIERFAFDTLEFGERIRIDGLSKLSSFTRNEIGIFVPAFTPIETYLTSTGKRFREELKIYSS